MPRIILPKKHDGHWLFGGESVVSSAKRKKNCQKFSMLMVLVLRSTSVVVASEKIKMSDEFTRNFKYSNLLDRSKRSFHLSRQRKPFGWPSHSTVVIATKLVTWEFLEVMRLERLLKNVNKYINWFQKVKHYYLLLMLLPDLLEK